MAVNRRLIMLFSGFLLRFRLDDESFKAAPLKSVMKNSLKTGII